MRLIGPARLGAVVALSLLVGLNLILPAGAHVTKRLPHLFGHLDPRYMSVNEMPANANLLDGQDSTAFLGANAKAADADLLDGQNSTAFMGGPGKVVEGALGLLPGSQFPIAFEEGHLELHYACPLTLTDPGLFVFLNHSGQTVNVFVDNGSTNPASHQVGSGGLVFSAAAGGEFHTLQVHSPNLGITTIDVMSVHRASDCHVQAQAVISS
jgi:hypothetical protein